MTLPKIPAAEVHDDGTRQDYLLLHVIEDRKWVVARVPFGSPEPVTTEALLHTRREVAKRYPGYAFKVLREQEQADG